MATGICSRPHHGGCATVAHRRRGCRPGAAGGVRAEGGAPVGGGARGADGVAWRGRCRHPVAGCCWVMQWMPPPRANSGRASTPTTCRPAYARPRIAERLGVLRVVERAGHDPPVDDEVVDVGPVDPALAVLEGARRRDARPPRGLAAGVLAPTTARLELGAHRVVRVRRVALPVEQHGARAPRRWRRCRRARGCRTRRSRGSARAAARGTGGAEGARQSRPRRRPGSAPGCARGRAAPSR